MQFLKSFLIDSFNIVVFPKRYFQSLQKAPGYKISIIKALIYGLLSGICMMLWQLISGQFMVSQMIQNIVVVPCIVVALLFVGAFVLKILSWICKGSTVYQESVVIQSSLLVTLTINSLFSGISLIDIYAGLTVSIAISAYSLFMMYNALVYGLSGRTVSASVISIILGCLLLIFGVFSFVSFNYTDKILREQGMSLNDLKKTGSNNQEIQQKMQEIINKHFQPKPTN